MRTKPPPPANPLKILIAAVAFLVAMQWYGPGGYSHIKLGQHKKPPPVEQQVAPEAERPVFGPYELYGPFKKSAG